MGTGIEESDGKLRISLSASSDGVSGAEYHSRDETGTLVGKRMHVELTQPPKEDVAVYTRFYFGTESNFYAIELRSIRLYLRYKPAEGNAQSKALTDFDSVEHRFWQLREQDNVLHVEAASVLGNWNLLLDENLDTQDKRDVVASGGVRFHALTNDHVSDPGEAHFDNFNIEPGCAP